MEVAREVTGHSGRGVRGGGSPGGDWQTAVLGLVGETAEGRRGGDRHRERHEGGDIIADACSY